VNGYSEQKLIIGTHTSDSERNYLMIAKVRMPIDDTEVEMKQYDDHRGGKKYKYKFKILRILSLSE
jgi:hypothetical protein